MVPGLIRGGHLLSFDVARAHNPGVEQQAAAAAAAGPNKRQRRAAKREEEERVRAAELRQLKDPAPQSKLDFERLVSAHGCPRSTQGLVANPCLDRAVRAGAVLHAHAQHVPVRATLLSGWQLT